MIFRYLSIFCLPLLLVVACKEANNNTEFISSNDTVVAPTDHPDFVSNMETAHEKLKLLQQGLVCFNLDLTFGDRNSKMKIFTASNSSAIRVDKKNGASTVMIHGETYTDADSAQWISEKFGVFTYQYFFMAPYKFSDSGTIWTKLPDMEIEGENTNRAMLTFESGVGDAPDDWYIVHSDPKTHRVKYIGYIVTGGGATIEEAEKNAHAIKYSNFKMIHGVPIAFKWEFFDYTKEEGLGKKIGEGIINNVEMMDVVDQFDIIHDGTYSKI